jgi:RND family efflux transporter MFP subunit
MRRLSIVGMQLLAFILPCSVCRLTAQTIEVESVLIRLIDQVDVPARALGALETIHVAEGSSVTKGQLLAQIDDTEAKLNQQLEQFAYEIAQHNAANDIAIRSAEKAREFAAADYERLYRAAEDQPRSVSKSELEKSRLNAAQAALELERARSELEVAKIEANANASKVALAKRNVEVRKITAPSSGVVVSQLRQPGEWVTPGDKIFRIVRTDRLRAEGFVAATAVLEDLRGAAVVLVPEGADGRTPYAGEIVFVSPEIDPVNGQVRVAAEVNNLSGRLRPGLRARMTIVLGESTP